MNYTIVNSLTNEIKKVSYYPKSIGNITDILGPDEQAFEGNKDPRYWVFDGANFTPTMSDDDFVDIETPFVERDTKSVLVELINELSASGTSVKLHREVVTTKRDARDLIDQAASRACERFVSQGKFTVFEYQLTQQQVKEWRTGGSIEADAPEMLKSWFENSDYATLEDAAANIEQTATQFNTVIQLTRRLRLEGKKAVTDATGEFKTVMESYINQLDSI